MPTPGENSVKMLFTPSRLEGGVIGRVVEMPDGSGRVETWDPAAKSWRIGGARVNEFFTATEPSPALLRELGIPSD